MPGVAPRTRDRPTAEELADRSLRRLARGGTCEGLAGEDFATVQFHPEAAPGPLDALPFFDQIAETCRSARIFVPS